MFFIKEWTVADYDCDSTNRIKPSAIMRYMQQTSSDHLTHLGISQEMLLAENIVFMLTKSNLKFFRLPKAGEKIVIGTAPIGTKGPRFYREFTVEDMAGNRLISCLTLWILVDPASHKILRPSAFTHSLVFAETRIEGHIGDEDLPKKEENTALQMELPIRYSHIDCNGHVNNSFYADFVLDSLPPALLAEGTLDTLVISFQNEAKIGDKLLITREDHPAGCYHIYGSKADGGACFDASVCLHVK
jgi:acyl-ACP thioesterase